MKNSSGVRSTGNHLNTKSAKQQSQNLFVAPKGHRKQLDAHSWVIVQPQQWLLIGWDWHKTGVSYLPEYEMPLRIWAANLASKQSEKLMVLFGPADVLGRLQCVISESMFSPYICAKDNYCNKGRLDNSIEGTECIRPVSQRACWIRSFEIIQNSGLNALLSELHPSVLIVTGGQTRAHKILSSIFLKRSPHVIEPGSLGTLIEVWPTLQVADLEPFLYGF